MRTLTKDGRNKLTIAIMNHGLKDQFAAFIKEETEVFTALNELMWPKDVRESAIWLQEKTEGKAFDVNLALYGIVAGRRIPVGETRGYRNVNRKVGEQSLEEMLSTYCRDNDVKRVKALRISRYSAIPEVQVDEKNPLAKRVEDLWDLREDLNGMIETRRAQIVAILAPIRNEKQLEQRWPEVMPLATDCWTGKKKEQSTAIALPTQELNAALGLPPENENDNAKELEAA